MIYQQSRVQEEIDRVIGAERAPCHDSDAGRMPLTEAVICEVQRLNTILPLGVPHGALQVTYLLLLLATRISFIHSFSFFLSFIIQL